MRGTPVMLFRTPLARSAWQEPPPGRASSWRGVGALRRTLGLAQASSGRSHAGGTFQTESAWTRGLSAERCQDHSS